MLSAILSETVDIWFISTVLSLLIILMSMRRKCYNWEHIPLHSLRYVPTTITAKLFPNQRLPNREKTCPMPVRNLVEVTTTETSACKISALFHLQLYVHFVGLLLSVFCTFGDFVHYFQSQGGYITCTCSRSLKSLVLLHLLFLSRMYAA